MIHFELQITETARANPKDQATTLNVINGEYASIDQVQQALIHRYGKLPRGRNKVYQEDNKGNSRVVGFLHSFWNRDWSHASKKWFQTDWITITMVDATYTPILLNHKQKL